MWFCFTTHDGVFFVIRLCILSAQRLILCGFQRKLNSLKSTRVEMIYLLIMLSVIIQAWFFILVWPS
ncbi:hypothetical protein D917_07885, partial [Trichinella nativa]